ncbi:hypothetical protein TUBRATIS_23770 [Tubulinosema ratisbonensis]|uniref:Uncharacterized protein n=1 Tax=Tubulinosema ratisbonensis TaxID=291195 RepID=A0A437AJ43_9MICR|nr:hypothetical protein TUBRATIS_23770 [Tubulinosema ratisbonensis]
MFKIQIKTLKRIIAKVIKHLDLLAVGLTPLVVLFVIRIANLITYTDQVTIESFFSTLTFINLTISSKIVILINCCLKIFCLFNNHRREFFSVIRIYEMFSTMIYAILASIYCFYTYFLFTNMSFKEKTTVFTFINEENFLDFDKNFKFLLNVLPLFVFYSCYFICKNFNSKISAFPISWLIIDLARFIFALMVFLTTQIYYRLFFFNCYFFPIGYFILINSLWELLNFLFIIRRENYPRDIGIHLLKSLLFSVILFCLSARIMFEYSILNSGINEFYKSFLFNKEWYSKELRFFGLLNN